MFLVPVFIEQKEDETEHNSPCFSDWRNIFYNICMFFTAWKPKAYKHEKTDAFSFIKIF